MTYRFLSPARQDLIEAIEYYDQKVPGLGADFLEEVERAIGRILMQPEAWAKIAPHHRRCRTRRFPYGLIYTIQGDEALISAVMNLRRHPDSWRLKS